MERRYVTFHTARGCLAGLAAAGTMAVSALVIVLCADLPVWAEIVAIATIGAPLVFAAFVVDRRATERPCAGPGEEDAEA